MATCLVLSAKLNNATRDNPEVAVHKMQLLEQMTANVETLLASVESGLSNQRDFIRPRSVRLLTYRGRISVVEATEDLAVAYTSTADGIVSVCLRGDPSAKLLFAIVVHELAHLMEVVDEQSFDENNGHSIHGTCFKADERWLMGMAQDLGLVDQNGPVGRQYCGITIPDPDESR
jgi:hypothetical protein